MSDGYSADDFIETLKSRTLNTSLTLSGFAKPVDGNQKEFLFSPGMSCGSWTLIPAHMVEKAEFLSDRSASDYSCSAVRIQIAQPPAGDASAEMLFSLLRASTVESPALIPVGLGAVIAAILAAVSAVIVLIQIRDTHALEKQGQEKESEATKDIVVKLLSEFVSTVQAELRGPPS